MDLGWETVAALVGTALGSGLGAYRLAMRRRPRRLPEERPAALLAPDDQPRVPTRKEWHELTGLVQNLVWEMTIVKKDRETVSERFESFQHALTARLDKMAEDERERYECLSKDIGDLRVGLATRGAPDPPRV